MKKQILLNKWLSRWSAIKSAHQSCCRDCLVALPPAVVERVVAALDDSGPKINLQKEPPKAKLGRKGIPKRTSRDQFYGTNTKK